MMGCSATRTWCYRFRILLFGLPNTHMHAQHACVGACAWLCVCVGADVHGHVCLCGCVGVCSHC